MTLTRKLAKAKAANDEQEATRLRSRIQLRQIRLGKAASYLYAASRFALRFIGIPLPIRERTFNTDDSNTFFHQTKIDLVMNRNFTPANFIAEMIQRLFADKPKFFIYGQRIVGVLGVTLAALKWAIDPATGLDLHEQACIKTFCFVPEVYVNYAIAMCVSIIAAFQLPTPPVNDQTAQAKP